MVFQGCALPGGANYWQVVESIVAGRYGPKHDFQEGTLYRFHLHLEGHLRARKRPWERQPEPEQTLGSSVPAEPVLAEHRRDKEITVFLCANSERPREFNNLHGASTT